MPSLEIKGKKTGIIFDENGEVDFAKVLFEIEGKKCKEEYKKIFEKEE